MMKVEESYLAFRRKLKSVGKKVTGLTPRDGFEVFQEFYANERVLDVEAEQGDGLAAYFGMSRDGDAVFEVGMVRVFRRAGVSVHDANARLRLSFAYPFIETVIRGGLDKMRGWPEGNKFCWTPTDRAALNSFISECGQIQAVLEQVPRATKLRFENIWGVF